MSFTAQDLVYYLLAAAGAVPLNKPGIYLVSEEDNDLVEKRWTGTEIADQVFIASDVRKNSPALYLLNEDERCVFCVDVNNILRCYKYDADEDEWEGVSLQCNEQITVHPSSRLSGCVVPEGQIVFFENLSGQFHGIRIHSNGRWELLPPIPVCSQQGSTHSVVVSEEDVLNMLYIHQDNHIHHLTRGLKAGEWHDNTLPGSGFENDRVTKFMPILSDDLTFEICVLSSTGKLIRIDKEGVKTGLGDVIEGRFIAPSSEECVIEMMSMIKMAIMAATGICRRGKKKPDVRVRGLS